MNKYYKKANYFIFFILVVVLGFLLVTFGNDRYTSAEALPVVGATVILYTMWRLARAARRRVNFELRKESIFVYSQPNHRQTKQDVPYKNIVSTEIKQPNQYFNMTNTAVLLINTDLNARLEATGLSKKDTANISLRSISAYSSHIFVYGLTFEQAGLLKQELDAKVLQHRTENTEVKPLDLTNMRTTNWWLISLGLVALLLFVLYSLMVITS